MSEWLFISRAAAEAAHEEQVALFGGVSGVRDEVELLSLLERTRDLAADPTVDAAMLAAVYAFGVVQREPFIDGNLRTALVLCELFLDLNGWMLTANDADCVAAILAIASTEWDEQAFADWVWIWIQKR